MQKRTLAILALAAGTASTSGPALAAELEADRFYAGGGISDNEVGDEDATGYQFFGGYELPVDMGAVEPAVELGFWDSGDFHVRTPAGRVERDAEGMWANGVFSLPVAPRVDLIGRAGLSFGDDDGLMAGGGAGFELTPELDLRGEYVVRDDTDSLQANLVYRF